MESADGEGVRSWSPVRNNKARAIKPGKRPNSSPAKNFHHILVIPQKLNTGCVESADKAGDYFYGIGVPS